jgi:hypothetical protein
LGEGEHIGFYEVAILQVAGVRAVFGARKQALGKIDAGDLNVGVPLGETARVEAGSTGYFKEAGFRTGASAGPKGIGYGGGVIAE